VFTEDLVFENLEEPHHALGTGRGESIDIEPTNRDRVSTENQRLDYVSATAHAAIQLTAAQLQPASIASERSTTAISAS
jgi:hypothetical protein